MANTLILDYDALRSKIGYFMGYGSLSRDVYEVESWTADQKAEIEEAVQDGLRWFYSPPPLPGERAAHEWTFLRQRRTFCTTQSTVFEYDLTDEYAGYEGNLTIRTSSAGYTPIVVVGEAEIRQARSLAGSVQSGIPCYAAILAVSERSHRLLLHPTPGAAYTIEGKMLLAPRKLSKDNPYPYGCTQHSMTILEACLAAAERTKYDMDGHHLGAAFERLAASIQVDKKASRGTDLGYNLDPGCPETGMFGGRIYPGTGTSRGNSYVMD